MQQIKVGVCGAAETARLLKREQVKTGPDRRSLQTALTNVPEKGVMNRKGEGAKKEKGIKKSIQRRSRKKEYQERKEKKGARALDKMSLHRGTFREGRGGGGRREKPAGGGGAMGPRKQRRCKTKTEKAPGKRDCKNRPKGRLGKSRKSASVRPSGRQPPRKAPPPVWQSELK